MAEQGKIQALYTNRDKTDVIFPKTKTKAISDDNGVGLDALLSNVIYSDPDSLETATAPINVDTLGGLPANDYALKTDLMNLAPAGFGLGEAWGGEIEDCNDAIGNGWFNINASVKNIPTLNDGTTFPYSTMLVTARYDLLWQEVYSSLYGIDYKFTRSSTDRGATWTEWSCDNPPMLVGVEYRTTERWDGNAVYTKLVNCGALPNASTKSVSLGLNGLCRPIRHSGLVEIATGLDPRVIPAYINGQILVDVTNWSIIIKTDKDFSTQRAYVQVWYYK